MVVGVGFEPTYATRADLQSAAFNHSATPPNILLFQIAWYEINHAFVNNIDKFNLD